MKANKNKRLLKIIVKITYERKMDIPTVFDKLDKRRIHEKWRDRGGGRMRLAVVDNIIRIYKQI